MFDARSLWHVRILRARMGARAINRANTRRRDRAQRRAAVLARRTAVATGVAIGAGSFVAAPATHAATYEVTTLDDSGAGSLREAIAAADADPGHDTITFAPGLSGTIHLTSRLEITTPMTIEGPGADVVTIDGGNATGLFAIDTVVPGAPVTISGLTLTHGRAGDGGAIFSDDALLTVRDSVITGNTATSTGGGITGRDGGLVISGTRITDNTAGHYGGGVHYNGISTGAHTLSISDSVVTGNTSAREGGGLSLYDVYADAEVRRTTVSGNTAGRSGGGIWFEDTYQGVTVGVVDSTVSGNTSAWAGGGISFGENFKGLTQVVDSTIVDNHATHGGGIQFADVDGAGRFAVVGSTITGNTATDRGGGIFRGYHTGGATDTPLEVTSTVVSDNIAGTEGPDISQSDNVNGDLTLGNSLVGDPSGAVFVETPNGNLFNVDPQLGPLADNGGPTLTRLPADSSPLINAGLAGGRATDQRGLPRVSVFPSVPLTLNSDGADIGAVELQAPPAPPAAASPPVVIASTPLVGSAGTPVTIRGGDFAATVRVLFGDTPASFVVDGHDQITAVAPDGLSGTVAIVVVTAAGRSAPTPAGQFTYLPAPSAPPVSSSRDGRELVCARVPSLVGRTLDSARRILDRDGCEDVPIERKGTRPPKRRRIVAQRPKAGTPLYAGDAVVVRLEPPRRSSRSRT